ncbi:MAG TPA: YggU family protein [Gammaproteobacteria bacterium]|nr:YggU family protein [Gammaproteobacteria bacterium]
MTSPCARWQGDVLILDIRLQPRASRDAIAGLMGERLRIRITAPPVDGRANAHLLSYLSEQFQVPKRSVSLLSGQTGRDKRVAIRAPRRLPPEVADLIPQRQ